MKGLLLKEAGGNYNLVDTIDKPVPGKKQVLVKSLVTAINPVEGYMQGTGLLITAWPIVLGCDASGVVVELGEGVTKYKKGDGILGCTVLGTPGHSTFQEYEDGPFVTSNARQFLMNEDLSIKRPDHITTEQAATVGVGLLTAALGLFSGTHLEFKAGTVNSKSPWVVVLGAAGSVGQYAVQLLKLCGYKVLASCSPSNNEIVKAIGADATFSYKLSLEEQIAEIEKLTGGNYSRVFDASAAAQDTGVGALAQNKSTGAKYFSTVNDWSPIESKGGVEVYKVTLGDIGRTGSEHIDKVNQDIRGLITKLESHLKAGDLKPQEYVQVGDVGVGEILKALEAFNTHKSGKKIIVRLAEE